MPSTKTNTIGSRIRIIRLSVNKSQAELAKELDVHTLTVSKYERDQIVPCLDTIIHISLAYDINLNWLILGHGKMAGNE